MAEYSMYKMIMELPLFKGITADQVSALVEKTHMNFMRFGIGEKIITAGEECTSLYFIISGSVRLTTVNATGNVALCQTMGKRAVLGDAALFGWSTAYSYDAVTLEDTSLLSVDKHQYLQILQSDPIYLLNYCNLLSLKAQRAAECIRMCSGRGLPDLLGSWVATMTDHYSSDIELRASDETLCKLTRCTAEELSGQKRALDISGLARSQGERLIVTSRRNLLDFFMQSQAE